MMTGISAATGTGTDDGQQIRFSRQGAVATIRFNRPAALNAIDAALAERLLVICRELAGCEDVRVVVLSGEGKSFMAGGDLSSFHEDKVGASATAERIIAPLHEALLILAGLPQLVIGSVHGTVAGAGVSMALACDLCLAADDTRFNLAYARIGTSPDAGATWMLPRIVGVRKALELALLAENIPAAEAARLGIINKVVPATELAAETAALARRLAEGPAFAYAQIKQLMRASLERTLPDQLDAERLAFRACAASADFGEGLDAFFEKRMPAFKGR